MFVKYYAPFNVSISARNCTRHKFQIWDEHFVILALTEGKHLFFYQRKPLVFASHTVTVIVYKASMKVFPFE